MVLGFGFLLLGTGLELVAGDMTLPNWIREAGFLWPALVVEFCGPLPLGFALMLAGAGVLLAAWRHGLLQTGDRNKPDA